MAYHDDYWPAVRAALNSYKQRKKQEALPPQKQREVEAVEAAFAWLQQMPDGERICKMLRCYHIDQRKNLAQSAAMCFYSERQAQRYNKLLIHKVALELGYIAPDGVHAV